jgi:hypothetical protein
MYGRASRIVIGMGGVAVARRRAVRRPTGPAPTMRTRGWTWPLEVWAMVVIDAFESLKRDSRMPR